MDEDAELLRRYAEAGSEAAFTELIGRHVDLVYSAALRLINGDVHRAQDITQRVFTELARQGKRLARHPAIIGWLYTTTRLMALREVRSEQRRKAREQEAYAMNDILRETTPEPDWARMRPVLDQAMHELSDKDRLAVLLRFFQNKALKDVGQALGLSENAARMRVERALEKLRAKLARRGIASTATVLASTLAGKAVATAPAAFVATLANASFAAAAATSAGTFTVLNLIAMTKLQLGVVAAVIIAGVATPLLIQHQSATKLREENQALRRQLQPLTGLTVEHERLSNLVAAQLGPSGNRLTLKLPAPRIQGATRPAGTDEDSAIAERIARLVRGTNPPTLTTAQLESYLKENRRSAESLLAAFRATGDQELLREALEKYPHDPQVNFAAVFEKDVSAEKRRQRLEAFKQAAPGNALANYLSAVDYFKAGQADQAVEELLAASGKQQFQDYSAAFIQNAEEAWRAAGYADAEAKTIGSVSLLLPQLAEMKQLGLNLVELAGSYRQAGDEASARAALQMGIDLGLHLDQPDGFLLNQLVGITLQGMALKAMDPGAQYVISGNLVKDELEQLAQRRASVNQLAQQVESLQQQLSAQDWISYMDRCRTFGEQAAARWLVGKYGAH